MSEEIVEQIREIGTPQFRIDREQRMVWNVALAGAVSKNGYRYSEESLRGAVGLYAGKPVLLDHASPGSRPQERSARDMAGTIVEARYEEGRVRGDIRILETEAGETLLALLEGSLPSVGMSHVVLVERSKDATLVERIVDVVSVDVVVFPATTTFSESACGGCEPGTGPAESWRDERELLVRERAVLEAELRGLAAQLEAGRRAEWTERWVQERGIAGGCVTPAFLSLVNRVAEEEVRQALLEERVSWWKQQGEGRALVRSVERRERVGGLDEAAVIAALRPGRARVLTGVIGE